MRPELVLVPGFDGQSSFAVTKSEWGRGVTKTLERFVKGLGDDGRRTLRLALSVKRDETTPWHSAYPTLLRRLAFMYRLVAIACVTNAVSIQTQLRIDIEVVMVLFAPHENDDSPLRTNPYGPIVPLEGIARAYEIHDDVYFIGGDGAQEVYENFQRALKTYYREKASGLQAHDLLGASSQYHEDAAHTDARPSREQCLTVAVGGTFDHLHLGHRLLLTAVALALAERDGLQDARRRRLIVGITGDKLLQKKKFASLLQTWDQRQLAVARVLNAVANYGQPFEEVPRRELSEPGPNGHAVHYEFRGSVVLECVEISDPFGPTITDEAIDALVVSGETRSGGKAVNEKRKDLGWRELDIIEVDVLNAEADGGVDADAEDYKTKISSTAIRERLAG